MSSNLTDALNHHPEKLPNNRFNFEDIKNNTRSLSLSTIENIPASSPPTALTNKRYSYNNDKTSAASAEKRKFFTERKKSFRKISDLVQQTIKGKHKDVVIVYDCTSNNNNVENKEETQEFVTKRLIQKWNSEIGNTKNQENAEKRILHMRKLAGLEPSNMQLDIPSARMGLCLLAGLDNQKNKIYALDSLLTILKQDNYKKNTSIQLVSLAIQLLNLMDREVVQAADLNAQNKIAEVYNILTETLHRHYGKGHINAITKELKQQLLETAQSLEKLNRLEDVKLKFNVNCAIEGVRRLKDDRQELYELAERVYNVISGAASVYFGEPNEGFERLEDAFKDLDPHMANSWYDAILVLKTLAKDVNDSTEQLTPLLMLIGRKFKELNWKFSFAAIEILFHQTLYGNNEQIRLRAFNGFKQFGFDFPGLANFAHCNEELNHYKDYKQITHLEYPQTVDPNVRIRHTCIKYLAELLSQSKDETIKNKAQTLLHQLYKKEEDSDIVEFIKDILKKTSNSN